MDKTIPPEIVNYFEKTHGQILLVKGATGTGKSTFAIEAFQAMPEDMIGVGVFPRMDRHEIYASFEVTKLLEDEEKLQIYDRNDRISDANRFDKEFQEICRHYDPRRLFFIIDTIDSIIEKYDNPRRKLKELISIFQTMDVNAILVQEEGKDAYLDYLVGGIITVNKALEDDRTYRSITIDKLRGIEVEQPTYLMTLKDGRCTTFGKFNIAKGSMEGKLNWVPLEDSGNFFSTGIKDLDDILGGGYQKGSYNVIEIADNVSIDQYMPLVRPVIINFLALKRGVILVTPGGEHPESVKREFLRFIDNETFEKYMRIVDYYSAESSEPYVLALGTTKERAIKAWTESITLLRGEESNPILDFTGLDTVEYQRGETIALRELINGVASIKVSNDLGIGLIKPGLKLTQGIKNMADTYFKILNLYSTTCLYGVKPDTEIYCALVHYDDEGNWITLKELV